MSIKAFDIPMEDCYSFKKRVEHQKMIGINGNVAIATDCRLYLIRVKSIKQKLISIPREVVGFGHNSIKTHFLFHR